VAETTTAEELISRRRNQQSGDRQPLTDAQVDQLGEAALAT
jgi:hypothetical protein